jgi:hypothetical protein
VAVSGPSVEKAPVDILGLKSRLGEWEDREKKILQLLCFPRRYIRAGDIASGSSSGAGGKFGAGIWKKASPFSRPTPGSADPRLPAAVR